jgi:hypothetical protein
VLVQATPKGVSHDLDAPIDDLHAVDEKDINLMKFDDQNRQSGIEALAGSIRLKARLLLDITGFDCQISSEDGRDRDGRRAYLSLSNRTQCIDAVSVQAEHP